MLAKTASKIINEHLDGKVSKISNKMLNEIVERAILAGFVGPFKVLKVAAFGDIVFDFYKIGNGHWTGKYYNDRDFYKGKVKKTASGTAIWKIYNKNDEVVGWGSYMPEIAGYGQSMGRGFYKEYPAEVEKCFDAANEKLRQLINGSEGM